MRRSCWSSLPAICAALALALLGCGAETGTSGEEAPPDSEPRYLTYRGRAGSQELADTYLLRLGAPPTFDAWKAQRNLDDVSGSIEYVNKSDLGFGRRLTWKDSGESGTTMAVCVDNFGKAGQRESDGVHALGGDSSVAVCMDYDKTRGQGLEIQFFIYQDGHPATSLAFDRQGPKLSPFACTACHGGRFVERDTDTGESVMLVRGGQFLPLLRESITFEKAQSAFDEDEVRKLNRAVYAKATSPGIRMVLDAAYPDGLDDSGSTYHVNAVPEEWQSRREFYQGLLFPNCFTCHVAHAGVSLDPTTPSTMALMRHLVCDTREMPNSVQGQIRFGDVPSERQLAGCEQ